MKYNIVLWYLDGFWMLPEDLIHPRTAAGVFLQFAGAIFKYIFSVYIEGIVRSAAAGPTHINWQTFREPERKPEYASPWRQKHNSSFTVIPTH